jgi:hypothetical protein
MYIKKIGIGEIFGTRTVIEELIEKKYGYILYLVQCKCGEISKLSGAYLRQYPNRTCRTCSLKKNNVKGEDHYNYKHGRASRIHGKQRLYHIWISMRERCNNPNAKQYKDYGGRGIKICKEWDSVDTFCIDMGERPSMEYTLDRIDSDGNYSKENCRWATPKEQANNKRTNKLYTINGEILTQAQLIEKLGWTNDKFRHTKHRKGIEYILNLLTRST